MPGRAPPIRAGMLRLIAEAGQPVKAYDLLAKVYVPEDQDVGHFLAENLFDIPGIVRTLTTMTFKAF